MNDRMNPIQNGPLFAVDALGRHLNEFPPRRQGKTVGVFYFLGSGGNAGCRIVDVTKILQRDPEAYLSWDRWIAAGGVMNAGTYWGKPLFGYYSHEDEWVILRHIRMLMDADVDYIIFDTTNNYICKPIVLNVLSVLDALQKQGFKVPQVAFYTNTNSPKISMQIFEEIYLPNLERYEHLWFRWDGKPLMICHVDNTIQSPEFLDYFTIKDPIWPNEQYKPNGWPWMEFHRLYTPETVFGRDGRREVVSVSVAQHCDTGMFSETAFYGHNDRTRSWHNGANDSAPDAPMYGYNFVEQFEWAIEQDPETIFVTGWNEWCAVAGHWRENYPIQMCDCVTLNCSRDIEPMEGGYEDNYYMQLCQFVRRFKGCDRPFSLGKNFTVDMNGPASQFDGATAVYRSPAGDTANRDHAGWGEWYADQSGRNDIVEIRVMHDSDTLYFNIKTAEKLTPPTDDGWMTLFLSTGNGEAMAGAWDLVVNRLCPSSGNTAVERRSAEGWQTVGHAEIRFMGNDLMISLKKEYLGNAPSTIAFKVADHYEQDNVTSFYTVGDCAPYGRMSFVFSMNE